MGPWAPIFIISTLRAFFWSRPMKSTVDPVTERVTQRNRAREEGDRSTVKDGLLGPFKETPQQLKGGLNLNVIFASLDMALMEISRSRFKQSKNSMLIP